MKTTEKIANDFIDVLNEWLTDEELRDIVQKNRAEENDNICHTHDYCDANIAMIEAMEKNGFEYDCYNEKYMKTFFEAWEIAKKKEFKTRPWKVRSDSDFDHYVYNEQTNAVHDYFILYADALRAATELNNL